MAKRTDSQLDISRRTRVARDMEHLKANPSYSKGFWGGPGQTHGDCAFELFPMEFGFEWNAYRSGVKYPQALAHGSAKTAKKAAEAATRACARIASGLAVPSRQRSRGVRSRK